jgi:hypothetical protein
MAAPGSDDYVRRMARAKRTPRARTERRRARAENDRFVQAKRKLYDLEPGGSRERPIDVPTPALVEPKAKSLSCPRCDALFGVEAHEAHADDEHGRLREAKLHCLVCGERRSLWFRIVAPS